MTSFQGTLSHPLDQWQKDAIASMDKGHSVFAAVPTGSGKTIVAEYAVHLSMTTKKKVVYTSPLKAISNQKFNDFSKKFPSVGIITGDIQLNESADVILMTTEILRKMLGVSDPRINEIGWVIFDEVHYMSDKNRGTVWEESLILMPDHIRCVFLSATVPNADAFASWYSGMHSHPVDVFSISKRPVPLTFSVVSKDGISDIGSFDSIKADEPTVVDNSTVKLLLEKELTPAIVFSCNRKRVETVALRLSRQGGIVTTYQSNAIKKEFDDLLRKVGTTDTFHIKYREYASEGVGVHHAGMLPYCKEIIEQLFCSGKLPILVSTETFAMGVNGPARSVVFESLEKFDGNETRMFHPHEFIQMAGRAGRRGFDTQGTVIVLHDPKIPRDTVGKLTKGKPKALQSSMYMTPQLVLQCTQRNTNLTDIIQSSFETFNAFVPTDEEITQVRKYENQTRSWQILLAHQELWRFFKGHECILDSGVRGKLMDDRNKVMGSDGVMYSRGIVEVLGVNLGKIKVKSMDAQIEIGKLKKTSRVDRPERYDKIQEYSQLSELNDRLLSECREIYSWLEDEKLIIDGVVTPLGKIACGISSICPVLGTKLITNAVDIDIVHAIATFPSEASESVGKALKLPFPGTPKRVNWNLVRSAGEWYNGKTLDSICDEYGIMPGNFFQMMIQCKNTLMELISVVPEKENTIKDVLEDILTKINRDSILVKSLYV
ncbi:helicase [Paramecium bursaria Chlorella virus Can18-4]|nr:helicase [Paramecium bursaria Chlorella virus Can18-4]